MIHMSKTKQGRLMAESGYIPVSSAATICCTTVHTIYRWLEQNKIKGERIGHHWFIEKKSLKDYLGEGALKKLQINELFDNKCK